MKKKIAINGFGRIGRIATRINAINKHFELSVVNDINPYLDNMAYLFKYDSTYGKFSHDVSNTKDELTIDGNIIKYTNYKDIHDVPWDKYDVDLIIDASGVSENVRNAKALTRGTSKKVIITHSTNDSDIEIIMGINDDKLENKHQVVSNSICDANAIAHVLKWMDEEYGIKSGAITTLHPWLSYQNLVDGTSISQSSPGVVWNDFALGRASTDSIIPKNTTAVLALEKVMPELNGKIMSFSYRIPTDIVASSDITLQTKNIPSKDELTDFIKMKIKESTYVKANYESLVSLDYEREEHSAILDMQWLKVENGMIKIILWYDNEWGYCCRVLDLAKAMLSK